MTVHTASEEYRNDPALRLGCRSLIAKRQAEAEQVALLLDRALSIMATWRGDPVMDRPADSGDLLQHRAAIRGVQERYKWLSDFLSTATDTYVGNVAAFLSDEQAAQMREAVKALRNA